jgi:hypothetical protein
VSERWREPISTIPTQDVIDAKAREGWRPAAIEWVRDGDTPPAPEQRPIPYGLRLSSDGAFLEVDPTEREVMSLTVALIAGDHPLSKIAAELNARDYRTRQATRWSELALFKLLPRIVESGPEILSADEWSHHKQKILSEVK